MSESLEIAIEENATGPKRIAGDAGSVEQHSITDQIAADKHISAKKAAGSKGIGIKFTKLVPGGTV